MNMKNSGKEATCKKLLDLELNCWIAETFFGFVWAKSNKLGKRGLFSPGFNVGSFTEKPDMTEEIISAQYDFVPQFCASIDKAWKVVEKMREQKIFILFGGEEFYAHFYTLKKFGKGSVFDRMTVPVFCDNPARAICEAAYDFMHFETEHIGTEQKDD